MNRGLAATVIALMLCARPATAQDLVADTAAVRDRAIADTTAWDVLESLTTEIGARPVGSPALARARDWAQAKLKALGFTNVHAEAFEAEAWIRGEERAEVISPYPQTLQVLGLGRSISTPKGGLEAEIKLFKTYDALLAAPPGSLKGRIAVVTQPMVRTMDGAGYGDANRNRTRGAAEASRRGAAAYLVRSLSTDDTRLPHTGATHQAEDAPAIPAAALSVPDAELLERMVARGQPVRVRLNLQSRTIPKAPAWNVSGEIPGLTHPEEVIVVGGHLDSWDPGTGAHDDGAGVAITVAAARLAGVGSPRRTIRVVLWGAEELDDSGEAYAVAHRDEAAHLILAAESDTGDGPVWQAKLPKGSRDHLAMRAFALAVGPLKVIQSREPAGIGGSDVAGLNALGVPSVGLTPDASRYFDLHHSADDTLDKIDPADLAQSVAVWASFLNAVAHSDIDFRALAAP